MPALLRGRLAVRFGREVMRGCRVSVRFLGMLGGRGLFALFVVIGGCAVGLRGAVMMIGRFFVGLSCHFQFLNCAVPPRGSQGI